MADPNNLAKMAVLQKIMDLFTDHQLSGLKKKGQQPDMVAVSVKKDDAPTAEAPKDADGDNDGDEDPDLLKALLAEHDESSKSDPSC